MSITGEDTRIVFTGDGSDNSPYAIDFHLRDEDSVEVIYVTDSTGAEVVKDRGVDYSIAIANDFASATLTLITTAPATGETLLIRRNEPATRLSNYKLSDGQPAAVSNNDFDVRTMSEQTLQEQLDRALVVAKGHPDANLPLTPLNMIGNAGAGLIVNAAETNWEFTDGTFIDGAGTLNTIPLWTPDGSTLGDSIMAQSGTLITVGGTLTVNSNAAGTTILGRAKIGSTAGNDDVAVFAHFDFFDAINFAVEQSNLGHVRVNAPVARSVVLSIGDNAELTVEGTLVNIPSNEFRVTLGDVNILAGALSVEGTITAGSGSTVLTTAAGLLRHQAIDPAIAGAGLSVAGGVLSTTAGDLSGTGTNGTIPLWTPDGDTLGDSALTQLGLNITASGAVFSVVNTLVGGTVSLTVTNSANSNPSSHAEMLIQTTVDDGGNPFIQWRLAGASAQSYLLGIDNSDSDKLIGSVGTSLGTANWLEVTTARGITLDAASGQTVALAVNSTEELQVSGTAVTIPTNSLIVTMGDVSIGAGTTPDARLEVGTGPQWSTANFGANIVISGSRNNVIGFLDNAGNNPWAIGVKTLGNLEFNTMPALGDTGNPPVLRVTFNATGIGIGNAPTLPFDVNAKAGTTSIGGYTIKLTNKSGGQPPKGSLVIASTGTANAYELAGVSDDRVIGIVLDGGVSDGSEAWIVVAGFAEVLMDGGGAALGDRIVSSTTAGSGLVANGPASAIHFQEVGHAVGAIGAGGLVKCSIHLN